MNKTSNLAVLLMAGTLTLGLYGCGGGGGGSDDTTTTTADATEILVDSPQKLAEAISFEGAQEISGDFPVPTAPTGGTLTVAPELSMTAGGTSTLSVTPTIEDGYYVHAYIVQIQGSDKTFVIPVGPDGQPYGTSSMKTSASDLLEKEAGAMVSYAPTTRERVQLNCTGKPSIRFTQSQVQNTTPTYTAPATVQTYVQNTPPSTITQPSYDVSNIQWHTDNWSEPANVDIKVTDVGSGNFQITLTWDTTADVDLYLVEPDGHEIHYASENSIMGDGYLDIDDLDGFGPENIYFDTDIPSGQYTVKVNMYSGFDDELPTNYVVTVKRNGQSQSYNGSLQVDDETDNITTFTQ